MSVCLMKGHNIKYLNLKQFLFQRTLSEIFLGLDVFVHKTMKAQENPSGKLYFMSTKMLFYLRFSKEVQSDFKTQYINFYYIFLLD